MATSFYKAQAALRVCEQHDEKELNYYCKTCGKTVCTKCVKSEHNSHDWELISEYLKERRRQLPKECGDLQNTELVDLQRKIERYEKKLIDNQKELEKNEGVISSEQQRVIDEINRLFKEEKTKCKKYFDDRKDVFEKERDELEKKLNYLRMMSESFQTQLSTFSDHDVIEMEQQMKNELKIALRYDAEKHIGYSECVSCDLNMITSKLEIAHTLSLEEVSSFKPATQAIFVITAIPHGKAAWVRAEDDKIHLFSENGLILQTLNHSGTAFEIGSDGKFLLIRDHMITMLDGGENVIQEVDMAPLYPQSLALTKEGDVLLSLKDGGNPYTLDSSSRRIVRHMTPWGKILHTYEFKDNSKTRLFTFPGRLVENKNTDVCVINLVSQSRAELIVLTREGKLKFCFRGNTGTLYLSDVKCDSKCRILLSDIETMSLILLDSEGTHISVIHTFKDLPTAISLKDDKLWCGFSEGFITVYEYK